MATVPPRVLQPGDFGYDANNPGATIPTIAVSPDSGNDNPRDFPLPPIPPRQVTGATPSSAPAARPNIQQAPTPAPSPPADPPLPPTQTRADLVASIEKHRRPRCYVKVGDQKFFPIEAEVVNNNYYAADTFHVVASLSNLPASINAAYWSDASPLQIEVFFGLIPDGGSEAAWTSMILGNVDDVEIDDERMTLTLTGRDRTADFIETKTSERYLNLTSSQVAQQLCRGPGHEGMVCDCVATTTLVGTYYHGDHARLRDEHSEWEMLTFLAEQEGFDVWVSGNVLHFKPSESTSQAPYAIRYTPLAQGQPPAGTLTGLTLRRSLLVAKDVTIRIVSFNAKTGKSLKVERKMAKRGSSPKSGGAPGGNTPQIYTFRVAGLTQQQAEQLADKKLKEITKHERVVDGFGPGDLKVEPRMKVSLSSTGTSFDQIYYCDAVERKMSQMEGFTMSIRLKNHSPESTV